MKRVLLVVMAGMALAACGGGSSSGGGGGGGGGGGASTEIGYVIPATDCTGTSIAGIEILIASNRSIAGACGQASNACVKYANLDGLALIVANFDGTGGTATAVVPGTYPLTLPTGQTGTLAFVGVDQTDASCNSTGPTGTATGSVTISTVTAGTITGSYDVTVGAQNFKSSFNATVCASGAFQGDVCGSSSGGTCTGTMQCL